jgi:DnaJ-class molecular chaperone
MPVEIEVIRLVSDNDECPHCNGIGKVNLPGAPDCPYCKGTGMMELSLHGHPKNEARIIGTS